MKDFLDPTFIVIFFLLIMVVFFLWVVVHNLIAKISKNMKESFQSLSLEVMERNQRSFLDIAEVVLEKHQEKAKGELETRQKVIETLFVPFKEAIEKVENYQRQIEKQREGAYSSLHKQIEVLISSENFLRTQTSQLVQALRSPNVRGSWGQLHLRRVVELAGMLHHCDFFEQKTQVVEGKIFRPDLVVKLPGDRQIIVDAKTPLEAYLEGIESVDEERKKQKFKEHAVHLRKHVRDLSGKEYWKQFDSTAEYVVLFLPAESFFSMALQEDPSLLEEAMSLNVLIATPTTLMAMLRTVAHGWKQESMSKSAKEIAKIGQEFYERISILNDHFLKLGKSLSSSVESYNQTLSSFESRVLISARKLKDLGVVMGEKEVETLEEVSRKVRSCCQEK